MTNLSSHRSTKKKKDILNSTKSNTHRCRSIEFTLKNWYGVKVGFLRENAGCQLGEKNHSLYMNADNAVCMVRVFTGDGGGRRGGAIFWCEKRWPASWGSRWWRWSGRWTWTGLSGWSGGRPPEWAGRRRADRWGGTGRRAGRPSSGRSLCRDYHLASWNTSKTDQWIFTKSSFSISVTLLRRTPQLVKNTCARTKRNKRGIWNQPFGLTHNRMGWSEVMTFPWMWRLHFMGWPEVGGGGCGGGERERLKTSRRRRSRGGGLTAKYRSLKDAHRLSCCFHFPRMWHDAD